MSRQYQISDKFINEVSTRQYQVSDIFIDTTVSVTYTATVGLSGGSSTLAAVVTFSGGTHTAAVALASQKTSLASSATFAPGTHTASVGLSGKSTTLSGSATFSPGTHTATAALVGKSTTLAATTTFTVPTYHSTTALTSKTSTLAAAAIFATVVYQAAASLSGKSSTLTSSVTFVTPPRTASVSLLSTQTALIASASFSSGSGPAPAVPTLSVVDTGSGVATATITSGSSGSINSVYYKRDSDIDWTLGGIRTGNGDVVISGLVLGRYFAYDVATLNGQIVASNIVEFFINGVPHSQLAHSPADIVRHLLIDLGRGSLPEDNSNWPIFTCQEADSPDSTITTYDTSGILDGRTQTDGQIQEHFGVQIRVRASDHPVGYAKINEVCIWMDEVARENVVTIDSNSYLVYAITRKGGIASLGKELSASKRNLYTVNAIVSLVPVA